MIGRSDDECYKKGLSLPLDDEISSTHARIKISTDENGEVLLFYRDCGSMNGSYINSQIIEQHENLENFDKHEIFRGFDMLNDDFPKQKFEYMDIDKDKGHSAQITSLISHSNGRRFLTTSFDKSLEGSK